MTGYLNTKMHQNERGESPPRDIQVTGPRTETSAGERIYQVNSQMLAGPQELKILLPDVTEPGERFRVLYILPVEPASAGVFGCGLEVLRKLDAHNRYRLILVGISLPVEPWYADHATDPLMRQASYLKEAVIPLVERTCPTTGTREGRLLFGFSKSGWGALTLLLRDPDFYGYAASWDAPLMLTEAHFGVWNTEKTFGTRKHMAGSLPCTLLRDRAAYFQGRARLVVAGERLFGSSSDPRFPCACPSHTGAFHELATSLGVRHLYAPDVPADHTWNPVWVEPVLERLLSLTEMTPEEDKSHH